MRPRLVQELGGPRWHLGDEPLHAGAAVELEIAPDVWIAGRYEYSIDGGKLRPLFLLGYACGHRSVDCADELVIALPANVSLRCTPPSWSRTEREQRTGLVIESGTDTVRAIAERARALQVTR